MAPGDYVIKAKEPGKGKKLAKHQAKGQVKGYHSQKKAQPGNQAPLPLKKAKLHAGKPLAAHKK